MQREDDSVRGLPTHSIRGQTLKNEIVFKTQEKDGTEMWNPRSQDKGQVDFWTETCTECLKISLVEGM